MEDRTQSNWPIYVLVVALILTIAISLVYSSRQREQTRELTDANHSLSSSVGDLRSQLQAVIERLNTLSQPHEAAPARVVKPRPRPKAPQVRTPEDPRWNQIQTQLSDQQKQIEGTREDLGKARDELSGSIATTHDELVALQKRGERNYYEFDLDKSKQFRRIGPVSLSLRKANVKRKSYDLNMLVDDNELRKKSVNLYETVWINLGDRPQPVELVVNQISKDRIQGYVSEPKYKKSELSER
jgi:hypothetical protein